MALSRNQKRWRMVEMGEWVGVSYDREKSPGAPDAKISPPKLPPNFSICPNDFSLNGGRRVVCLIGDVE